MHARKHLTRNAGDSTFGHGPMGPRFAPGIRKGSVTHSAGCFSAPAGAKWCSLGREPQDSGVSCAQAPVGAEWAYAFRTRSTAGSLERCRTSYCPSGTTLSCPTSRAVALRRPAGATGKRARFPVACATGYTTSPHPGLADSTPPILSRTLCHEAWERRMSHVGDNSETFRWNPTGSKPVR